MIQNVTAAPGGDAIGPWAHTPRIHAMRSVMVGAETAVRANIPAGTWQLAKIAPRTEGHALVLYRHSSGAWATGQCFAEQVGYQSAWEATAAAAQASHQMLAFPEHQLFWQLGGVDCKLPGLAPACQRGAELIVHHPERRAVVRLADGSGRYTKFVRPKRIQALVAVMQQAHTADVALHTPQVLEVHPAHGAVTVGPLRGRSLLDWLADVGRCDDASLVELGRRAGRMLAALHASAFICPTQHDAAAECEVLALWLQRLAWVAPALSAQLQHRLAPVQSMLHAGVSSYVPLHRDCYDKQFIGEVHWSGSGPNNETRKTGSMGLLDFDTLARGEAALDVANMLVHCQLRAWQGVCSGARALRLAAAIAEGYGVHNLSRGRLQVYADATRLRLACVYGCRPPQHRVVQRLAASIGQPVPGTV